MTLTVVKTTALTGTITNAQLAGGIDLTAKVTGTLPIANGGTNSTATTFVNATTNVTGALPIVNGGTGATSFTPGKVAQVVQAICAGGDTSTTSSTDQSSNVAVAITPSASDSKVLIHMTFGGSSGADYNKTLRWRLYRGTTALGNNTSLGAYNGTDDGIRTHNMSLTFLDSPSTTSATTYTLKFACSQNDSTVSIYASGESQAYAQATEILA